MSNQKAHRLAGFLGKEEKHENRKIFLNGAPATSATPTLHSSRPSFGGRDWRGGSNSHPLFQVGFLISP